MRAPYGSNWRMHHAEAYRMWLARHDEPEPAACFGMRSLCVVQDAMRDVLLAEVRGIAAKCLTRSQMIVFDARYRRGLTLDEVGLLMDVSRERVRQIEAEALRKVRRRAVPYEERNSVLESF